METNIAFKDIYSFPGFKANAQLKPHPSHTGAWIVSLSRRQKKQFVPAVISKRRGTISALGLSVTLTVAIRRYTSMLLSAGLNARGAAW
jgi:hypothetical protein